MRDSRLSALRPLECPEVKGSSETEREEMLQPLAIRCLSPPSPALSDFFARSCCVTEERLHAIAFSPAWSAHMCVRGAEQQFFPPFLFFFSLCLSLPLFLSYFS